MDEKILEKMITRSFVSIENKRLLVLSAVSLFIAGIFWLCSRAAVGHITGPLHTPLLILSFSLTLFPLAPFICPLALFIMAAKKKEKSLTLSEASNVCWKPSLVLLLQGVALVVAEIVLAIISILWSFLDAVPIFGAIVHLFSSWIPSCISFVMLILVLGFCMVSPFIGVSFIVSPLLTQGKGLKELLFSFSSNWLLRTKLYFLGYIPLLFFITFFTGWDFTAHVSYAEFCATVFRLAVFSIIASPCFLFLVHMAVETERYCMWRSQESDRK